MTLFTFHLFGCFSLKISRMIPPLSYQLFILLLMILLSGQATSNNKFFGDTPPFLLFGQSCPLTGANQDMGIEFSTGIQAAFHELNTAGTLPTKLLLQSLDDQYVPQLAFNNTQYFIQNGSFFGLLGSIGTPTSALAWPLAKAAGFPYIGPLTGTMSLRIPFEPDVINIRSSYNDETAAMVEYLVNILVLNRISLLYQNDAFGQSGLAGLTRAMDTVNLAIYTNGTYVRNTLDVEGALESILQGVDPPPQAIVMIGTYAPLAKFVRLCRSRPGFDPSTVFLTVSFVNAEALVSNLGSNSSSNVIVAQVVPPPTDQDYLIVQRFQSAMSKYNSSMKPTFVALEGYVLGRFVGMVIDRMQVNYTRQHFIQTVFETSLFRMDGLILGPYYFNITYNPYAISLEENGCNQGIKKVWLTEYNETLGEFTEIATPKDFYPLCAIDVTTILSPVLFASISSDSGRADRFGRGVLAAFDSSSVTSSLNGLQMRLFQRVIPPNLSPQEYIRNSSWYNRMVGYLGNDGEIVNNMNFLNEEMSRGKTFIGAQTGDMSYRKPYHSMIINVGASIQDELYALVHFLVDTLQFKKLVLIKDTSPQASEAEQVYLNELEAEGLAFQLVVVVQEGNNTLDIFHAAYNIEDPPDALIFASETSLIKRVSMLFAHKSVWRAYTSLSSWEDVQNLTSSGYNQVYYSAPIPYTLGNQGLPLVSSFTIDYLSKYPNDSISLVDSLVFEGYLQGMFVIKIISHMITQDITGNTVSQELSAMRTFDVGGVKLGPFSNISCSNNSISADADCECNQGMRSVYIYTLNSTSPSFLIASRFDFGTCGVILSSVTTTWDSTTTVTNIGITAVIVAFIGWAFLAKTYIF